MRCSFRFLFVLALPLLAQDAYREWNHWGGSPDNIHYSANRTLTPKNVGQLKLAWTYDSGDAFQGSDIQANPIVVKGVMYTTTPSLKVVAVDVKTGKQLWVYDGLGGQRPTHKNRGLNYWTDGREERILLCLGYYLQAIDAKTGKLDAQFGSEGKVDLREAFDRPKELVNLSVPTPGAIYKDLLILGSSVPENLPSTPGDIRAYNVRTGKLAWKFHTVPRPGEPGHETWPAEAWKHTGGANSWAGLVVDQGRGLAIISTGSAAFDFYGADRHGDNLYANSILALDANTGTKKWHFQAIRHDVWDLDFPSAPLLVKVKREGKMVDAVAQCGKDGFVWLLDRETGKSLFPLQEVPIPASTVEGEKLAKTQVVPTKPAPFSRQEFKGPDMVTNRTPEARRLALERLKNLDYGPRFTPPSLRGTIVFPGFSGGAEWGGQAFDPETRLLYVNANEMPWILRLVPPRTTARMAQASRLYQSRCAACHRDDMKGAPPEYPAVDNLAGKFDEAQLNNLIAKGSGRMPGFANLGEEAITALSRYLLKKEDKEVEIARGPKPPVQLKYTMDGYNKFLDHEGYPAITPPWGTLSAINLDTGEYAWKVPFGEYPELVAQGLKNTGAENHGGGVVTAGGLFLIGASAHDRKLRAYDKKTGKLLWETVLPFGNNATIAMTELEGKPYVLVPMGGGRGKPSGSQWAAFTLL
ncbi:MAG: PQQ-binding-like beta-propeller repeat protein [Bryobacter sp.]|nr:PQQ-binding-like beta-propeller repeat protein [Bryobacter sp.]